MERRWLPLFVDLSSSSPFYLDGWNFGILQLNWSGREERGRRPQQGGGDRSEPPPTPSPFPQIGGPPPPPSFAWCPGDSIALLYNPQGTRNTREREGRIPVRVILFVSGWGGEFFGKYARYA